MFGKQFQKSLALSTRNWFMLLVAAFVTFFPAAAFAAGGEDVALSFDGQNQLYLIISAVFGVLAVICGVIFYKQVMAATPGDEKMQEVGAAVKAGALAYLQQQRKLITIFVLLLGALLGGMYYTKYGQGIAIGIAACFVLGVAASYIAGYVGMLMAVNANMRTAAAALTSYKKSLEVSFRAGAVAGMMTVGLGLIGATLIFWLGGKDAMKYLIGFGFGGSLAALFMRVGGGIYTKAADVGADLVGKVEAGIPEDDPRNPAVIADNVGDNVGDCAGMAADVFESYEVTLVAAIVLGAATAAIFPQEVWMKLVLFALMARGVGVLASILGIFSVKGSDDVNSDPLKAISKGFAFSAVIAGLGTAALAYVMMGGMNGQGGPISTTNAVDGQFFARKEQQAIYDLAKKAVVEKADLMKKIRAEAEKTVTAENKPKDKPVFTAANAEDLAKNKAVIDLLKTAGYQEADYLGQVQFALSEFRDPAKLEVKDLVPADLSKMQAIKDIVKRTERNEEGVARGLIPQAIAFDPKVKQPDLQSFEGFTKLDWSDARAKELSTPKGDQQQFGATDDFVSFESRFKKSAAKEQLKVMKIMIEQTMPANGPTPAKQLKYAVYFGPVTEEKTNDLIKQASTQNTTSKFTVVERFPVDFMINKSGEIGLGVNMIGEKGTKLEVPQELSQFQQITYYKDSPTSVKQQADAAKMNPQNPAPRAEIAKVMFVEHNNVEWWRFAVCILVGILMAFVFERMTDYYVSTHKRPTKEVGSVASAGPAPMIIQGFAHGMESSVFSVLSICVSLMVPLLIFPPGEYGGYLLSFYGIALVGLGLLTTTGYILAMDTFGPISDNAQGVFEMSGAGHTHKEASLAIQRLDAAGNTTKALTKGFAIATAVVAAVALFHSYVEGAHLSTVGMPLELPEIFIGLLIGGAAPFLFSAFLINAVGRASFQLIGEVRRQFRADAGIMAGTSKPDYGRCVAIVTAAAQKELLGPGILAIALPVLVVFGLAIGKPTTIVNGVEYNLTGAQALGGFLAGTILSGQLLAVLLANSGGIWDNAKKLIEDGLHGGKGTDAHKAGVVCDTVGDPFKDTAGPALNPLIKVMNLVALLLAPYVIFPGNDGLRWAVVIVALILLVVAFVVSKRGSLASEMEAMAHEVPNKDEVKAEA